MHEQDNQVELPAQRSASWVWIGAVMLVIIAWAGAFALRGGGEKELMTGWADGMEAGQVAAQEADKPMVVMFTASWCGPCQQMKKNVLTKATVRDALQASFVPVQIDLSDRSPSNPNLQVAQDYGVSGIPSLIAMTPDGEPIDVYRGGSSTADFTRWLSSITE